MSSNSASAAVYADVEVGNGRVLLGELVLPDLLGLVADGQGHAGGGGGGKNEASVTGAAPSSISYVQGQTDLGVRRPGYSRKWSDLAAVHVCSRRIHVVVCGDWFCFEAVCLSNNRG